MILELDAGNTAIKWRVVSAAGEIQIPAESVMQDRLEGILDRWAKLGIKRARISCVAGKKVSDELEGYLQQELGIEVGVAQTQKIFDGLEISYEDPRRLGVDRWLAMLAARRLSDSSCCVIDCGSAITVDLVRGDGRHRGGYIVPGLALMRRSVLGETQQITMSSDMLDPSVDWGVSTDQAVNFGICRMAVSLIESIANELNRSETRCDIYLTGGDADTINAMLSPQITRVIVPGLVLDGLAIALP